MFMSTFTLFHIMWCNGGWHLDVMLSRTPYIFCAPLHFCVPCWGLYKQVFHFHEPHGFFWKQEVCFQKPLLCFYTPPSNNGGSRISQMGSANPWFWSENLLFDKIFAKNCMKTKEIRPRGCASLALSLPVLWYDIGFPKRWHTDFITENWNLQMILLLKPFTLQTTSYKFTGDFIVAGNFSHL